MDIGIVLIPNKECIEFSNKVTEAVSKALPSYKQVDNNPHITIIHIANLNADKFINFKEAADDLLKQYSNTQIKFKVTGIKATGGTLEEGYKWIDTQFDTPNFLKEMRGEVLKNFCPFHDGVLERMHDDASNFIVGSQAKKNIDFCGVTYTNYIPHITSWYIDLPDEKKTTKLQDVADYFSSINMPSTCFAQNIALVKLGRNGNAEEIIETYPLGIINEEL